jgi:hypothetical protein
MKYDLAARFSHGVGPEPKSWQSRQPETTYCGRCGAPIWADWRGALHKCPKGA